MQNTDTRINQGRPLKYYCLHSLYSFAVIVSILIYPILLLISLVPTKHTKQIHLRIISLLTNLIKANKVFNKPLKLNK